MGGWVITKDHLHKFSMFALGIKSHVGAGQGRIKEDLARNKTIAFKLCDENGNVNYEGRISESWLHGAEEGSIFEPLHWALAETDCTVMKYKNPTTGKWEDL